MSTSGMNAFRSAFEATLQMQTEERRFLRGVALDAQSGELFDSNRALSEDDESDFESTEIASHTQSRDQTPQEYCSKSLKNLKRYVQSQTEFEIVDVSARGDCQFCAIADQLRRTGLRGVEITPVIIRNDCVQWLRSNVQIFDTFLQDEAYSSPSEYLDQMKNAGTWGDSHTLYAAANHYEGEHEGIKTLYLGYVNHIHYVSLKRKGEPDLAHDRPDVNDVQKLLDSGNAKLRLLDSIQQVIREEKDCLPSCFKSLKGNLELLEQVCLHTNEIVSKHLGKDVIIMGKNNVGKSWIINLILHMTLKPDSQYGKLAVGNLRNATHEAMLYFNSGGKDGKLHDFCANNEPLIAEKCPKGYRGYTEEELEEGEIPQAQQPLFTKNLMRLCEGESINSRMISQDVFLLPSQGANGGTTTPALTTIRFGSCWQLLIYYKTEDKLRKEAFEWVLEQQGKSGTEQTGGKTLEEAMKQRFKHTVREGLRPEDVKSDADIELHPDVMERAGKVFLYSGSGKNSNEDRRFVRDRLADALNCVSRKYMKNWSAKEKERNDRLTRILEAVVVFCPCQIIEDGGQITDSPGTDDADPFKKVSLLEGLRNHETVIAVIEKNLEANECVYEELVHSGFVENLLNDPSRYKLAILNYREKSPDAQEEYQLLKSGGSDLRADIADSENDTLVYLKQKFQDLASLNALSQRRDDPITSQTSKQIALSEQEVDDILTNNVLVLTAYPTFYASILYNAKFRSEFMPDNGITLDLLKKATNGRKLLALIDYVGRQRKEAVLFQTVSAARDRLSAVITESDSAQSRSQVSVQVDRMSRNILAMAPTKRTSADKQLGLDQANGHLTELVDNIVKEHCRNILNRIKDCFKSPKSPLQQALNLFASRCKDEWECSTLLTKATVPYLVPSLKGNHTALNLRNLFFYGLQSCRGTNNPTKTNDINAFIEDGLTKTLEKQLLELAHKIAQCVQETIEYLSEQVSSSQDDREVFRSTVASSGPIFEAIFQPLTRTSLTYGSKFAKYKKSDGSLDVMALLSKLRTQAEDRVMKAFLDKVQKQKDRAPASLSRFIASQIKDLFTDFGNLWCEGFVGALQEQLDGPKGLIPRLSKLVKVTSSRTEVSLIHHCFDYVRSLIKVDMRTKAGKMMKKEQDTKLRMQNTFRGLLVEIEDLLKREPNIRTVALCDVLEEIGEEIERQREKNFVFDFDDSDMFELRNKFRPLPFKNLRKAEGEQLVVAGLSDSGFVQQLVVRDGDREQMLDSIRCRFKQAGYVTSLDRVELEKDFRDDLVATIFDMVCPPDTTATVETFRSAILKEIEVCDNTAIENLLQYPGELQARHRLFTDVNIGRQICPTDTAYLAAWCCRCFNLNLCFWVQGRSSPVIVPGDNFRFIRDLPSHAQKEKIDLGHCYHIAVVRLDGDAGGQRYHGITMKLTAVRMSSRTGGGLDQAPTASPLDDITHYLCLDTNVILDLETKTLPPRGASRAPAGDAERLLDVLQRHERGGIALLVPYVVWAEELDNLPRKLRDQAQRCKKLLLARAKEAGNRSWVLQKADSDAPYKARFKGLRGQGDDRQFFFLRDEWKRRLGCVTMITNDVNLTTKFVSERMYVLNTGQLHDLIRTTAGGDLAAAIKAFCEQNYYGEGVKDAEGRVAAPSARIATSNGSDSTRVSRSNGSGSTRIAASNGSDSASAPTPKRQKLDEKPPEPRSESRLTRHSSNNHSGGGADSSRGGRGSTIAARLGEKRQSTSEGGDAGRREATTHRRSRSPDRSSDRDRRADRRGDSQRSNGASGRRGDKHEDQGRGRYARDKH